MPWKQYSVLIVDDSASDIQFLLANLKDDFRLSVAKDGEKALNMTEEVQPDVILMDVSMPGMDGYEVCSQIKSSDQGQRIEVIFVSGNNTVEEKLKGYDVGATDYLIKPVEPDELRRKVRVAIQRGMAERERQSAFDTAMLAMTDSGEQGLVVDFLRRSFSVVSLESLAELVVSSVARFGLACSVQIREANETYNASNTPPVLPLEIELMSQLADVGRLHQKKQRLIINFPHVTMLVKNMPEDEGRAGRLRDHLMLIAEAANGQCPGLFLRESLHELIEHSNQTLKQIKDEQVSVKKRNVEILDHMVEEVEEAFLTFGLTEDQEDDLLKIVKHSMDQSLDNFEHGLRVDTQMEQIVTEIADVIQMHRLGS